MTKYSLIITAGGNSTRYGKNNKLLEKINDKTVIEYTVSRFLAFDEIKQIIIAANKSIISVLSNMFNSEKFLIVEGGETRQKSVNNALQYVSNEYVLIHDGARPLISESTIKTVLIDVVKFSAVSTMTKTTDTIKEVDSNGFVIRTISRDKLFNTQTPQAFKTKLISDAHAKLINKNFTDDSSMLEYLNIPVHIVSGDYKNIKITTKSDLEFAKLYVK